MSFLFEISPYQVSPDRSYLITACAMNRDLFLPHNLFYNRKPSLAHACYPGIRSALSDGNEDELSEDGDYKILGVKQELKPAKSDEAKEDVHCKEEDTNAGMIRDSTTRSGRGFSRRLDVASRVQSRESLYAPSVSSPRPDQQFDPRRSRSQPTHSATKWPATLELSGKKIHDHSSSAITQDNETRSGEKESTATEISEINGNVENVDKTVSDSQKGILSYLPPLSQSLVRQSATPSASAKKMSFSPTFYADYGLRCEKTDTFPGLLHRRKREKSNVEIVKQIEEKANRHIYACQVLSNSKRGSKAAQSVNTLKQTVGPKRASASKLPTTFVRQHLHHAPERQATFVDVSKRAPFSLFIRTRESPDFSRAPRHKTAPLPEINGRTLILGFDTKH